MLLAALADCQQGYGEHQEKTNAVWYTQHLAAGARDLATTSIQEPCLERKKNKQIQGQNAIFLFSY